MSSESGSMSSLTDVVRKPVVMISIIAVVVIVAIWLFAFYMPENNKISKYNSQVSTLQAKQASLNAELTQLKTTQAHTPLLNAMQTQFATLIPPSADIYVYNLQFDNIAKLNGISPQSIDLGVGATTSAPAATKAAYETIPITVSTKATYDQVLGLIKSIYGLPRLTTINSITLSGGGVNTNRATLLSVSLSMSIFTTGTLPAANG
ncbi:MAG: type 4a pilus biogenesis protein PilO [Acidimicrobiales bacterium]